jgi:hypothetical protein
VSFASLCNPKCVVLVPAGALITETSDCIQKNNFDEGKCRKEVCITSTIDFRVPKPGLG